MRVEDTNLTLRTKNALRRNGVFNTEKMREVYNSGRMKHLDGVGRITLEDVGKWLKKRRLPWE